MPWNNGDCDSLSTGPDGSVWRKVICPLATQVREAERLISGSSTNTGAALSHPEEHQQPEGGR